MSCIDGDTCRYPDCICFDNRKEEDRKQRMGTDIVWETKREYKKENLVLAMGQMWECTQDHISNIFGTDVLENKYWKEYDYD